MPLWHNAIEPFEMYMRKWAEIGVESAHKGTFSRVDLPPPPSFQDGCGMMEDDKPHED